MFSIRLSKDLINWFLFKSIIRDFYDIFKYLIPIHIKYDKKSKICFSLEILNYQRSN